MKALLLSGYRRDLSGAYALKNHFGNHMIDYQIERLRACCNEIVVVLAGTESEEILRHSRLLQNCEMIFDSHNGESSLLSNLRAGLEHSPEWVVALPVELPCPEPEVFLKLQTAYIQAGLTCDWDMLTNAHPGRMDLRFFPLLITRSGNHVFRKTPDLADLEDPRLRINSIATPTVRV